MMSALRRACSWPNVLIKKMPVYQPANSVRQGRAPTSWTSITLLPSYPPIETLFLNAVLGPALRFRRQSATALSSTPVMAKKTVTAGFDSQLQELEQLVAQMERGELSLEQSLAQFERGIALLRGCEAQLKDAEQKVQILMQQNGAQNGTGVLQDFAPDNAE